MPEWSVFRRNIPGRHDTDAAPFVIRVTEFTNDQADGPPALQPFQVDHLGTMYIEFFPTNLNLTPNGGADLDVTIRIQNGSVLAPVSRPQIRIIPIPSFTTVPHFYSSPVEPSTLVPDLVYTFHAQDFDKFDRVVVMISNIIPDSNGVSLMYSYHADITRR